MEHKIEVPMYKGIDITCTKLPSEVEKELCSVCIDPSPCEYLMRFNVDCVEYVYFHKKDVEGAIKLAHMKIEAAFYRQGLALSEQCVD